MDPFKIFRSEKLLKSSYIHVCISGWILFYRYSNDRVCNGYLSGFAFHSFVVDSSEIANNFENIDTHAYIYIKELSNAKNQVELEILSFLPPPPPFSKWPPERKQMAWRISRSTGNYQTEGIPWVIKRTLPFPAEKRPFVPPYVYTLSWNRPSTDLSAKRIGLASFGKPDRAWLYSALILTFVRIPSIEEHRLRFLRENSSSLSGRYEGNLSSRGNLDFFLFIRFNLFSSSSSSSREKRKFENICEFVSNKF